LKLLSEIPFKLSTQLMNTKEKRKKLKKRGVHQAHKQWKHYGVPLPILENQPQVGYLKFQVDKEILLCSVTLMYLKMNFWICIFKSSLESRTSHVEDSKLQRLREIFFETCWSQVYKLTVIASPLSVDRLLLFDRFFIHIKRNFSVQL